MFNSVDTDGSGEIDFREFTTVMTKPPPVVIRPNTMGSPIKRDYSPRSEVSGSPLRRQMRAVESVEKTEDRSATPL
eukprot:6008447-Pyramimonas_sp.AAC.1